MYIQWFPGHMTKAMRMLQESVNIADCVVYVLDARAIASSFNGKFDAIIGNRPVLYVVNKCDMVEQTELKLWEKRFALEGKTCVFSDSTSGRYKSVCISKLLQINNSVISKYKEKGVNKCIRAIVVGVPNTGKSTLINCLCGSKRATTGNRPGVTKGKQWVSISDGIDLLDTPGTLPPAFDDNEKAVHLAMIGSVKEEVLDIGELALEVIKLFKGRNSREFIERYGIDGYCQDDVQTLEEIAMSRRYILGRNNIDYERASRAIIDDLRKLKFGKIMLDRA
ncbi:MAG: ribosome biogenesis GTPase YlqF [Clostridia bacterium]|nr:ribosome biogenesis GTPase YlqF [Clostridia bacterium]